MLHFRETNGYHGGDPNPHDSGATGHNPRMLLWLQAVGEKAKEGNSVRRREGS